MPEPLPRTLPLEALSDEAFAPFGQVIAASDNARHYPINEGYAERFHDLARIDTARSGGQPLVSIFRARPRTLPLRLQLLERHTLGSQAFVPMAPLRFLVVVAPAGPTPRLDALRCFLAAPGQGVNLAPGTWHHPLLALDAGGDFLVIDRGGVDLPGDCEEHALDGHAIWVDA